VRGLAVTPITVPQGEAIQLAACTALGKSSQWSKWSDFGSF
jgi:hypothetical protein